MDLEKSNIIFENINKKLNEYEKLDYYSYCCHGQGD